MGTHQRGLSKSYLMNTNMAGFRWFLKIFSFLCYDKSSLIIGRVKESYCPCFDKHFFSINMLFSERYHLNKSLLATGTKDQFVRFVYFKRVSCFLLRNRFLSKDLMVAGVFLWFERVGVLCVWRCR